MSVGAEAGRTRLRFRSLSFAFQPALFGIWDLGFGISPLGRQ